MAKYELDVLFDLLHRNEMKKILINLDLISTRSIKEFFLGGHLDIRDLSLGVDDEC